MTWEKLLTRTLVELADNLVADFDVVDLLTTLSARCVEVFDVAAAGIMLVDPDGALRLVTSSSEAMRIVELFELQAQEGPCLDSYRTGQPVACTDLDRDRAGRRSPRSPAVRASKPSMRSPCACAAPSSAPSTCSTPVGHRWGTTTSRPLRRWLMSPRSPSSNTTPRPTRLALNQQLTAALQSRIVIEQAKGMIAERRRIGTEEAFRVLRNHARNHNRRLTDVAADVTIGRVSPADLDACRTSR